MLKNRSIKTERQGNKQIWVVYDPDWEDESSFLSIH